MGLWLIPVLLVGVPLALMLHARSVVRRAARGAYAISRSYHLQVHEIIPVPDAQASFPEAHHEFYRRAQAQLEQLGFQPLGDIEYPTLRAIAPDSYTFLRVFAGPQAATAAAYHFRGPMPPPGSMTPRVENEIIEFRTILTDDAGILTSPRSAAAATEEVPGSFRFFENPALSPADLLEKHREHVVHVMNLRRGAAPRPIESLEEMIDSLRKGEQRRVNYRREIGVLTFEELRRMAPGMSPGVLRAVHREVQRLAQRDGLAS